MRAIPNAEVGITLPIYYIPADKIESVNLGITIDIAEVETRDMIFLTVDALAPAKWGNTKYTEIYSSGQKFSVALPIHEVVDILKSYRVMQFYN